MDVSFVAFNGGSGRMAQSKEQEQFFSTQRYNMIEKIPLPVTIDNLVKMSEGEEKYKIANYTFNTLKLVGTVSSIYMDHDKTCTTYQLCSPGSMAPHFTVIRYHGVESVDQQAVCPFSEGVTVQAVGKLRLFNNRLSLVAFHIRELIKREQIELFEYEAKLAHLYYEKNIPERSANFFNDLGMGFSGRTPIRESIPKSNPAFCASMGSNPTQVEMTNEVKRAHPVICKQQESAHPQCLIGQQTQTITYEQIRRYGVEEEHTNQKRLQLAFPTVQLSTYERQKPQKRYQTSCMDENSNTNKQHLDNKRALSGQQARIYQFVRENGIGECGVSLESIKSLLNWNGTDVALLRDINSLVDGQIIYATVDDQHFAVF